MSVGFGCGIQRFGWQKPPASTTPRYREFPEEAAAGAGATAAPGVTSLALPFIGQSLLMWPGLSQIQQGRCSRATAGDLQSAGRHPSLPQLVHLYTRRRSASLASRGGVGARPFPAPGRPPSRGRGVLPAPGAGRRPWYRPPGPRGAALPCPRIMARTASSSQPCSQNSCTAASWDYRIAA